MSRVRIDAQLILVGDAQHAATVAPVLQALEQDPVLVPALWGAEAGLRDSYDRGKFLAALAADSDLVPQLYRAARPCAYTAQWFGTSLVATLSLSGRYYHDADEAALFFSAMSRLAAQLPTEWGHVTPRFEQAVPGTAMKASSNFTHLGFYETNGPSCLFPRTFFGSRLMGLMPREVAESLRWKDHCELLANGTLQLDLVKDPWASDPKALKSAQQAVFEALLKTGIFCDRSDKVDTIPGPNWLPPPERSRTP